MSVVIGVHPGGRSHFATAAIFWQGKLPAMSFSRSSHSSVEEVLNEIVGVSGEWGTVNAIAVNAPLTWSPQLGGWRDCDRTLKTLLPRWAPKTWIRPPNALPGASAVQGPALVWAIAAESKRGLLKRPEFFEAHARVSLARLGRDLKTALLGYRGRATSDEERQAHIKKISNRLVDAGILKLEACRPQTEDEIDALTCALTALGSLFPDSGILVRELRGGKIRPVGPRVLKVIDALP